MALKHTQVRNEGCLHLHRQPPPLAVEDSIAWQLGASPNTLGITLQQQHLFSREQKAGGDASFYSFYAVLHHTQSLWDHLAQRITLCNDSLVPLKRAAALEEAAAHEPVSCTLLQPRLLGCCWWTLAARTAGNPHTALGSEAAPTELLSPLARSLLPDRQNTAVMALGLQPSHGKHPSSEQGARPWAPQSFWRGLGRDGHHSVTRHAQACFHKVLQSK